MMTFKSLTSSCYFLPFLRMYDLWIAYVASGLEYGGWYFAAWILAEPFHCPGMDGVFGVG